MIQQIERGYGTERALYFRNIQLPWRADDITVKDEDLLNGLRIQPYTQAELGMLCLLMLNRNLWGKVSLDKRFFVENYGYNENDICDHSLARLRRVVTGLVARGVASPDDYVKVVDIGSTKNEMRVQILLPKEGSMKDERSYSMITELDAIKLYGYSLKKELGTKLDKLVSIYLLIQSHMNGYGKGERGCILTRDYMEKKLGIRHGDLGNYLAVIAQTSIVKITARSGIKTYNVYLTMTKEAINKYQIGKAAEGLALKILKDVYPGKVWKIEREKIGKSNNKEVKTNEE